MSSTTTDRLAGLSTAVAIKAPVKAVAVSNITLSGEQTVNGVAVTSGDRVLVTAQTSSVNNGIYEVSTAAWSRTLDFDGNRDIRQGTVVFTNSDTSAFYRVSSVDPMVIGTSAITFTEISLIPADEADMYVWCGTAGGSADAITLTPTSALTVYTTGQTIRFLAAAANTGATTVAVSGLAAKALTKAGTTALAAGDIANGAIIEATYDGTRFQLGSNFLEPAETPEGGIVWCGTAGGTANAITLTPSTPIVAYETGRTYTFLSASANTGSTTVAISGLTAKTIRKSGTTTLSAGDILATALVALVYDGTYLRLAAVVDAPRTAGNNTFTGNNTFSGTNTYSGTSSFTGVVAFSAAACFQPETLTYSATIATDATASNWYRITATNGTAYTISNPTNLNLGQFLTYTIRNTSGGAMGTITWGATFTLAAFTNPATGFSRSITFAYDGSDLVEISRTTADVPN